MVTWWRRKRDAFTPQWRCVSAVKAMRLRRLRQGLFRGGGLCGVAEPRGRVAQNKKRFSFCFSVVLHYLCICFSMKRL